MTMTAMTSGETSTALHHLCRVGFLCLSSTAADKFYFFDLNQCLLYATLKATVWPFLLQSLSVSLSNWCHPQGAWSANKWIPLVVKSSVTLSALPNIHTVSNHDTYIEDTLQSMMWLPADSVSVGLIVFCRLALVPPFA